MGKEQCLADFKLAKGKSEWQSRMRHLSAGDPGRLLALSEPESLLSRPKPSALGELLKERGVDRKYLLLGANKRRETPLTVPGAPFFMSYSSKTAGRLAIVMLDFPGKKLHRHQWQLILEFCKCQQKDV